MLILYLARKSMHKAKVLYMYIVYYNKLVTCQFGHKTMSQLANCKIV